MARGKEEEMKTLKRIAYPACMLQGWGHKESF